MFEKVSKSAEELIVTLYEARRASRAANAAVSQYMHDLDAVDMCENKDCDTPPCYYDKTDPSDPGYMSDWCETCKGRQPLWIEKKRKAIEAGKALTAVLKMGRKLSESKAANAAVQPPATRPLTTEERQTITDFLWRQMENASIEAMVDGMVTEEEFRSSFPKIYNPGETPKPAIGWSGEPK